MCIGIEDPLRGRLVTSKDSGMQEVEGGEVGLNVESPLKQ
jgi:hypothetical protein